MKVVYLFVLLFVSMIPQILGQEKNYEVNTTGVSGITGFAYIATAVSNVAISGYNTFHLSKNKVNKKLIGLGIAFGLTNLGIGLLFHSPQGNGPYDRYFAVNTIVASYTILSSGMRILKNRRIEKRTKLGVSLFNVDDKQILGFSFASTL